MDVPRNASKLADDANASGWQTSITTGRGALLNRNADDGFVVADSVAVRLRSSDDHVRAFGVWIKPDGAKWKFDNGWAKARQPLWGGKNIAPQGYRDLVGLVGRGEGRRA